MQNQREETEELARRLEATGDYKILRRLVPRELTPPPTGYSGKIGIILDFETTGLDPTRDEIIEVAMVRFRYSDSDEITGVSDIFHAFNEPSTPIPTDVVELTGITDAMVAGHKIDAARLERFTADVNIIIAETAVPRSFASRQ